MLRQYGLIKRKKAETKLVEQKLSFFDDDEDSFDDKKVIEKELKKAAASKKINKQAQLDIQRALEQDASIYDYDEVYDDMKTRVQEASKDVKKDRAPKYMHALQVCAAKRQQLNERRIERKVQKERDAEGDEFAEKEKFVTAAYRQKMIEIQEQEKEERLQDLKEDIMDVTKQKDMSGFYKHYLNKASRPYNPEELKEEKNEEKQGKETNEEEKEKLQPSEAENAKTRPEFHRKENHLAKRFRTKRISEDEASEEDENNSENLASAHIKHEDSSAINDTESETNGGINKTADDIFPKTDNDVTPKIETDVKGEIDESEVKPAKLESGQRQNETLAEFKERLKTKRIRRLDIYRRRNTPEQILEFQKRYQERKLERRMASRPI